VKGKRLDDMKALLNLELKAGTAEEAQKIVEKTCSELKAAGLIGDYHFEIEAPEGPVTERCVLSEGKVIA
jgi:phosphoribosylformylglycinamidine (FGAM) synthase PurS component